MERRLKRTVTIVSCNGMTVSDGDGTLASTIDSLVNAATLRIDFYKFSVPVIVMRHGNCRVDTFTYGQISEIIKWDHHVMSAFGTIIKPLWQFNPKSSRSSSTSSARGLSMGIFRNHMQHGTPSTQMTMEHLPMLSF